VEPVAEAEAELVVVVVVVVPAAAEAVPGPDAGKGRATREGGRPRRATRAGAADPTTLRESELSRGEARTATLTRRRQAHTRTRRREQQFTCKGLDHLKPVDRTVLHLDSSRLLSVKKAARGREHGSVGPKADPARGIHRHVPRRLPHFIIR
jgi:hypothetical protein